MAASCPGGSNIITSGSIATGFANTPMGGTLCLNGGTYSMTASLTVNKEITIVGIGFPTITQTSAFLMFNVTANNVTIKGLNMVGFGRTAPPAGGCNGARAIAAGSVSSLLITGNKFNDFTCGVGLFATNGFIVTNNYMSTISYAGVVAVPGDNGTVDRNTIVDVGHDGALGDNAYGFSASESGGSVSDDVVFSKNYVKNAPTWECYDNHDSQSIHFLDNVCWKYGRIGIASEEHGVQEITDGLHERNYIHAGGLTSQWNSITLSGAGNINNNIIRNFPGGGCGFFSPNVTPSGNTCTTGSTDILPPSIPTGLDAIAVSSSQINLTWTASVDDVAVTSYDIYRNNSFLINVATASYSNTGLAASTAYSYEVVSKDAAGNASVARTIAVSETTQAGGGGGVAITGWWKFDETSGTSAADSSGNGRTGTVNGGAVFTPGIVNGSLVFDGVDNNVTTGVALSSFMTASAGTMSLWMKPTGSPATEAVPYDLPTAVGDGTAGRFSTISRGIVGGLDRIWVYNWDGSEDKLGVTYTVGEWVHIVWKHDAGNLYIYKNGVEAGVTASGNTTAQGNLLMIGGSSNGPAWFTGAIDDVRIYDTGLAPEVIRAIYDEVYSVELFPPRPPIRMR